MWTRKIELPFGIHYDEVVIIDSFENGFLKAVIQMITPFVDLNRIIIILNINCLNKMALHLILQTKSKKNLMVE